MRFDTPEVLLDEDGFDIGYRELRVEAMHRLVTSDESGIEEFAELRMNGSVVTLDELQSILVIDAVLIGVVRQPGAQSFHKVDCSVKGGHSSPVRIKFNGD